MSVWVGQSVCLLVLGWLGKSVGWSAGQVVGWVVFFFDLQ